MTEQEVELKGLSDEAAKEACREPSPETNVIFNDTNIFVPRDFVEHFTGGWRCPSICLSSTSFTFYSLPSLQEGDRQLVMCSNLYVDVQLVSTVNFRS